MRPRVYRTRRTLFEKVRLGLKLAAVGILMIASFWAGIGWQQASVCP